MDVLRYQRQLQLPGFAKEGQQKLAEAKVLVVGAGGLGVPVLQYLAAMGVGTLGIVDADTVSLSNLHRQVIYTSADVGMRKVERCSEKLRQQNPGIQIKTYPVFLSADNAPDILRDYDVVVDATDNFNARYLINDACVMLNKPFVYGALQQFEGHVSVFNHQGGPTYRCLYPNPPDQGQIPDCNTAGVLGIVPGIIGSYQALEVIKVITGIGQPLTGLLQVFDFLLNSQYQIKLSLKPENKDIRKLEALDKANCSTVASLTAQELLRWIKEGKSFQLIDVREKREYQKSHLSPSYSFPLSSINGRLPNLDKDQPWVLFCQQGGRSTKAIQYLQERYPALTLFNLQGGINAWLEINGMQMIEQS